MHFSTPEVAWHNRDPVYSVDIQPELQKGEDGTDDWYRVATSGADSVIIIWKIPQPKPESKPSRIDQNNVLSQLVRHEKAVNVVRFIPTGDEVLASADVDGVILIWKKGEIDRFAADLESGPTSDRTASPKVNGAEQTGGETAGEKDCAFEQSIQNVENWNQHKVLRGHLEDVVDISWSADGRFLVSGSVDNEAIVWDVTKGTKIHMLSGHKNWVQGVAYDPLLQYLVTISADRVMRVFSEETKKIMFRAEKASLKHGDEVIKSKLFYDYTLQSFTRRLSFSPAGEMLLVPSGVLEFPRTEKLKSTPEPAADEVVDITDSTDAPPVVQPELELNYVNTCHLFLRNNLKEPFAYFPTGDKFCHAVKFCPTRFCLRDGEENAFPFPYRIIFAVATQNSVIFYDTQQVTPFACLSDIHYTRISDIAWSADGRLLIVSSTDGFCTFVSFAPGELGQVYEGEAFRYEPLCVSPGKAPPDEAAEPVTPDASAVSGTTEGSAKGKSVRPVIPEPIIKTPSVVTFFQKIPKQKRLETMQKELQELNSTPKRNKRKESSDVIVLDAGSDMKKSRGERDENNLNSPLVACSASQSDDGVDSVQATIDAVAMCTPPPHTATPVPTPDSLSMPNGTPVKSEKKVRRINLITLMKRPKDQA